MIIGFGEELDTYFKTVNLLVLIVLVLIKLVLSFRVGFNKTYQIGELKEIFVMVDKYEEIFASLEDQWEKWILLLDAIAKDLLEEIE